MIGLDRWVQVKGLHRQGWSIRKIARELGMDRGTVRKVLKQERPEPYARRVKKPSILALDVDFLVRWALEMDYCARPVCGRLGRGPGGSRGHHDIYHRGVLIARHQRCWERHRRVVDLEHYRGLLLERKAREEKEAALTPFPTLWPVSEPKVEVRDLAVYRAAACGEASHG